MKTSKLAIIIGLIPVLFTGQNPDSLSKIGYKYFNEGNYYKSLEYNFEALKIYENKNDKKGISYQYYNISTIYTEKKENEKAKKLLYKSIKICNDINYKRLMANCYLCLGVINSNENNNIESIKNYLVASEIAKQTNYKRIEIVSYINIGDYFCKQHKYNEGLKYFSKALNLSKKEKIDLLISLSQFNIGSYYLIKRNFKTANIYTLRSLSGYKKINNIDGIKDCYKNLSEIQDSLQNKGLSYKYYKQYSLYKDSLLNEEGIKKLTETRLQYEFEKQDHIREIQNQNQKIIIYCSIFILIILLIFYIQKRKSNKLLHEQKHTIEEKQKEILASLRYAKRIQETLMTSELYIQKTLTRLNK